MLVTRIDERRRKKEGGGEEKRRGEKEVGVSLGR